MSPMYLTLDNTKAGRTAAGLVYAGLSLQISGLSFPRPDWVDFTAVVLSWWAEAATRLADRETAREELRFMEGPYYVELNRVEAGVWPAGCFERAAGGPTLVHEGHVEAAVFVKSLLAAADATLLLCRDRKWWSKDADALQF